MVCTSCTYLQIHVLNLIKFSTCSMRVVYSCTYYSSYTIGRSKFKFSQQISLELLNLVLKYDTAVPTKHSVRVGTCTGSSAYRTSIRIYRLQPPAPEVSAGRLVTGSQRGPRRPGLSKRSTVLSFRLEQQLNLTAE